MEVDPQMTAKQGICERTVFVRRKTRWCLAGSTFALVVAFWAAGQTPALADEFNHQLAPFRQLLTPMRSVIDGKPFRDAIERIAQPMRLNVCIDRRVDPTELVHSGQLGPNVYSAIKKIAAERDCVVMPVAGVLLVGRASWVDATANVLIALSNAGQRELVTVTWDDLTTPAEALNSVMGETAKDIVLPHDLWPKTTWTQIDRGIALALVLAQFDLRPDPDSPLGKTVTDLASAESSALAERRYRPGKHAQQLRASLADTDRKSDVQVDQNVLVVKATATAHRLATAALLDAFAAKVVNQPGDDAVFSLKLKERAGAAIQAFAQRAGRNCLIDADAREACETIVTLEAQQKTLQQLTEMVAGQANLVVKWTDKTVIVSKAR